MDTSTNVFPVNPSGVWGDPHWVTCVPDEGFPRPPPTGCVILKPTSAESLQARLKCLVGYDDSSPDEVLWHFCFDLTTPEPSPRFKATWLGTDKCHARLFWTMKGLRKIECCLNSKFYQSLPTSNPRITWSMQDRRYPSLLRLEPTYNLTLTMSSMLSTSLSKRITKWTEMESPLPQLLP